PAAGFDGTSAWSCDLRVLCRQSPRGTMRRLIISAIRATCGRRWIGPHPSGARRLEEKFSAGGIRRRLDVPLKSKPRANENRAGRISAGIGIIPLENNGFRQVDWLATGTRPVTGRDRTRKEALDRGGSNLQCSVFYNGRTPSSYPESFLKLRVM